MVVLLSSHFAFGQQSGTDIVIGERISLPSKVFNTEMAISVYLPADYETSDVKYPVLYDLNSFAYFIYCAGTVELLSRNVEMPEMIIVGLPGLQNGKEQALTISTYTELEKWMKSKDLKGLTWKSDMKLHPSSPNAYDSVAECYLTRGDKAKAKEYYELAIQKNPGKTANEKRILQNSKDKLKELSQ
jgi:tetratricopeptide (TPR) repeat protein